MSQHDFLPNVQTKKHVVDVYFVAFEKTVQFHFSTIDLVLFTETRPKSGIEILKLRFLVSEIIN